MGYFGPTFSRPTFGFTKMTILFVLISSPPFHSITRTSHNAKALRFFVGRVGVIWSVV
jgi:hypothetical protein